MELCFRVNAGIVRLDMNGMREFFQPVEASWTSDTLQLKPDERREEVSEKLKEKFQGKLEVEFFEGAHAMAPAASLTPDLWGFLKTE